MKMTVMYVRLNEEDDGLHMGGPFFGGHVHNEQQLQDLVKTLNDDPNRPKGIIIPKTFRNMPMVDVFRAAQRAFDDMLEDILTSYAVTNKKKMAKVRIAEKSEAEIEREIVERRLRRYELLRQEGLEQLATKISDKRREELKKTVADLKDEIESTKIWLKYQKAQL
ncbi:MAG: hypothetical protein Q8K86_05735 [Candidatus Nanopelagicaceae bacterium]|nr:hypothetical protein [Candidatus Nanopelagicaceae bacterium]